MTNMRQGRYKLPHPIRSPASQPPPQLLQHDYSGKRLVQYKELICIGGVEDACCSAGKESSDSHSRANQYKSTKKVTKNSIPYANPTYVTA